MNIVKEIKEVNSNKTFKRKCMPNSPLMVDVANVRPFLDHDSSKVGRSCPPGKNKSHKTRITQSNPVMSKITRYSFRRPSNTKKQPKKILDKPRNLYDDKRACLVSLHHQRKRNNMDAISINDYFGILLNEYKSMQQEMQIARLYVTQAISNRRTIKESSRNLTANSMALFIEKQAIKSDILHLREAAKQRKGYLDYTRILIQRTKLKREILASKIRSMAATQFTKQKNNLRALITLQTSTKTQRKAENIELADEVDRLEKTYYNV